MQQLRRFVKEKEAFRHRMLKQRGGKSQIRSEPARWAVRSSDQENDSCCCNKRPDDNATGLQSSLICASRRHDVARSRRCESGFFVVVVVVVVGHEFLTSVSNLLEVASKNNFPANFVLEVGGGGGEKRGGGINVACPICPDPSSPPSPSSAHRRACFLYERLPGLGQVQCLPSFGQQ